MKTIIELASAACMQRVQDRWIANEVELQRFAALVEAARDAELIAGVEMPEPKWTHGDAKAYTADQMRDYAAAAVAKERERMADRERMLTDEELADPQYMKSYIEGCNETIAETLKYSKALAAELTQRDKHIVDYNTKIAAEMETMIGSIDTLTAERDALRDALQEMVDMVDSGDEHGEGSVWHTKAKKALEATK